MRLSLTLLCMALAAMLFVGCGGSDDTAPADQVDAVEDVEDAASDTTETVTNTVEHARSADQRIGEAKGRFIAMTEERLDKLDGLMDALKSKVDVAGGPSDVTYKEAKAEWDKNMAAAKATLEKLKGAGADAYAEAKAAMDKAIAELQAAYQAADQALK